MTEPSSRPSGSCTAYLSGPKCLKIKTKKIFTARTDVGRGGTFLFSTTPGTEGNRRVILYKNKPNAVNVKAIKISPDEYDDTRVYVYYTNGNKKCSAYIDLTVQEECP